MAEPRERVFINAAVCENCGDCSAKSNCISIQPIETELGRKRTIDQSSCNKDFSCLKGFCPSFVTVTGGQLRKAERQADQDPAGGLPVPEVAACDEPYGIVVAGVGGTGVITIGALLGMAAHLEGKEVTVLDSTGMSQKNGAVTSHVRVSATRSIHTSRIPHESADLLLGCDIVVATAPTTMATYGAGRTRALVNTTLVPPARFVLDRDLDLHEAQMQARLAEFVGKQNVRFLPSAQIARALLGDAIAANAFLLGLASQLGLLPVSLEALTKAIRLNGAAVEWNLRALAWGRRAAVDPDGVAAAAGLAGRAAERRESLEDLVAHRSSLLESYQNSAYAESYRSWVGKIEAAERDRTPGQTALAMAVARNMAKLMAYKDEYEVARLYASPDFLGSLEQQLTGKLSLTFHLAPPLLARIDPASGEPRKIRFGAWMLGAMRVLARLRFLRNTRLDPFALSRDRREERALIADYQDLVTHVASRLDASNHALAVKLLSLPDQVRGFGPVKHRSIAQYKIERGRLRRELDQSHLPIASQPVRMHGKTTLNHHV